MGLDAYVGTLLDVGHRDDFDCDEAYEQHGREVESYDIFVRQVTRRLTDGRADWSQESKDRVADLQARIGQYGVLHFLRRYACHVSVNGLPPPPVPEGLDPEDAAVVAVEKALSAFYSNWNALHEAAPKVDPPCRFVHLIWHSDCDGLYVPMFFRHPVFVPFAGSSVSIGSSPALLAELDALNVHLKLDQDAGQMSPQARDAFWENHADDPYLREKWVWVALHWLARMSTATNQPLIFA